jgi:hypothetical protein
MHRRALFVVTVTFGLIGSNAFAASEHDFEASTTGQLAALCATDPGDESATAALSFCHGFIGGAAVVYLEMVRGGLLNQLVCAPEGTTSGDVAAQLVAWTRANPDKAQTSVEDGLFESAHAKWPCP